MFILPYTLLGATISLASPAPIAAPGDAWNAQPPNHTDVRRNVVLGINCRGNIACGNDVRKKWGPHSPTPAQFLANLIQQLPDDGYYQNGAQLACLNNSICAFLQNMPLISNVSEFLSNPGSGAYGKYIKAHAQSIPDHGCKGCGSVPMIDKNTINGELTFNHAKKPCSMTETPPSNCICDPNNTGQCRPIDPIVHTCGTT